MGPEVLLHTGDILLINERPEEAEHAHMKRPRHELLKVVRQHRRDARPWSGSCVVLPGNIGQTLRF